MAIRPSSRRTYPADRLTPEDVQAVISACSATSRTGIRNRALLTLLYRSGLRISEAIGYPGRPAARITLPDGGEKIQAARPPILPLKVSDVNLEAHTIRLQHTKSGKAQTRGFHPSATDALARWIDVRGVDIDLALDVDDLDAVFAVVTQLQIHKSSSRRARRHRSVRPGRMGRDGTTAGA